MTSWNVSDWLYTAEGGKHAIFRYSPSATTTLATDNDNEFYGHVLRIAKSDLVSSAFYLLNQAESTSTSTPYQEPNDSKSSTQTFQKNIIHKSVSQNLLRFQLELVDYLGLQKRFHIHQKSLFLFANN